MTTAFVDTSHCIALLNPRDALHEKAMALSQRYRAGLVTTDFVLIELGNWCAQKGDRELFVRFLTLARKDAHLTIVPASRELFDLGAGLYAQRGDKRWSLTDCISFVVMRQHGMTEALTADHHFEQAGFNILLR